MFTPEEHKYFLSVDGEHWVSDPVVSGSKVMEHLGFIDPFPSDAELRLRSGGIAAHQRNYIQRFKKNLLLRPAPLVQPKGTKKLVPLTSVLSGELPPLSENDGERFARLCRWINSEHSEEEVFKFNLLVFGPYACMSAEEIFAKFKKAPRFGTKLHADIEAFISGHAHDEDPAWETEFGVSWQQDSRKCRGQFAAFWEERGRHLEIYRTEWAVYDEHLFLAGSIDMVTVAGRGEDGQVTEVDIWDWKTTGSDLDDTDGAAMFKGGLPLWNTMLNKYALQLRMYEEMLKRYGLKVRGRYLVVFSDRNKEYMFVDTSNMDRGPKNRHSVHEFDAAARLVFRAMAADVRRRTAA